MLRTKGCFAQLSFTSPLTSCLCLPRVLVDMQNGCRSCVAAADLCSQSCCTGSLREVSRRQCTRRLKVVAFFFLRRASHLTPLLLGLVVRTQIGRFASVSGYPTVDADCRTTFPQHSVTADFMACCFMFLFTGKGMVTMGVSWCALLESCVFCLFVLARSVLILSGCHVDRCGFTRTM